MWQQFYAAALPAPSGLTASDTTVCVTGSPSYKAHLSWTNGDPSLQVRVYDGTTLITTLAAGTTSYDHTGLTHHSSHNYAVKHYDGTTESSSSNSVALTIGANPCLAAPTITATDATACVSGSAVYKVHVEITSTLAWGHKIYRDGVLKATLAAGVSGWDDTTVSAGGNYSYIATEFDDPDEGPDSVDASVIVTSTDPCTPPALDPSNLTGSDSGFCNGLGNEVFQMDINFTSNSPSNNIYADGVFVENITGSSDTIVFDTGGNHTVTVKGYNGVDESPGVDVTVFLALHC